MNIKIASVALGVFILCLLIALLERDTTPLVRIPYTDVYEISSDESYYRMNIYNSLDIPVRTAIFSVERDPFPPTWLRVRFPRSIRPHSVGFVKLRRRLSYTGIVPKYYLVSAESGGDIPGAVPHDTLTANDSF